MKKIIFLIIFISTFFAYAQNEPDRPIKFDVAKVIQVDQTTRDSYIVPSSETWICDNLTTGQLEFNRGGAGWLPLTGTGNGTVDILQAVEAVYDADGDGLVDGVELTAILSAAPNLSVFNNNAGFITNPDDADADPTNEIQTAVEVIAEDVGGEFNVQAILNNHQSILDNLAAQSLDQDDLDNYLHLANGGTVSGNTLFTSDVTFSGNLITTGVTNLQNSRVILPSSSCLLYTSPSPRDS